MFSTFSANLDTLECPTGATAAPARRKRAQVAQACDWCRLNRIKCDERRPCQNCREHGGYSSDFRHSEISSLPAANRDVTLCAKPQTRQIAGLAHPNASLIAAITETPDSYRMTWDGLDDRESRTSQDIHYGPLASQRMVMRLNRFMAGSSNPLLSGSVLPICIPQVKRLRLRFSEVEDLSREQEEHFLVLLWQAYHCVYPIIVEEDFKEYYDSLWTVSNGQTQRQPSALVYSLLAVCIQYGSTFLVNDEDMMSGATGSQATHFDSAAHTFYIRSQHALMDALEYPSIMSLQSQIYCIIYVYNTANLNSAHALLGLAIRIAQMLHLHLPPLGPLPQTNPGLGSRIWWTLYQLDSHISMTLGRSRLINVNDVHSMIPTDIIDRLHVPKSVSVSPSQEDISWLSFHVHFIHFTAVARRIHGSFGAHCTDLLQGKGIQDIYENPPNLELLGNQLSRDLRTMYDWVPTVPVLLKNQRKGSGQPFSTDRTPLDLDPASPLWLQRQRLLLEIIYHHVQIANFRPFIRFRPRGAFLTPLSDNHSISALNHAVVMTHILNQVLSETDLLSGWKPVFRYQWDAAICILSFVLANPVCPPTPAARKVLPMAIQNLETLGHFFGPVTNTLRDIWEQFCSSPTNLGWTQITPQNQSASNTAVIAQASAPTSADITAGNILAPLYGSDMLDNHSQSFDLLLKSLSNMVSETELSHLTANTFPHGELHASFTLPSNFMMDTDIECISNGVISLNSWEGYGSP
ncbi:uncharacterized protein N7477_006935 [Penicillium maclennaniae]|uniref:uncharacterized protein n=1 Tax=Penicillium maclennaniae TaxID=1343394 RepID=UPI0025414716|nr:uncharacterized protein N7477_006935 [Penicillium maclennaniae]KAJ5668365.1 hypothetical protein N7477_006935 [Penicillium maclennaniae]